MFCFSFAIYPFVKCLEVILKVILTTLSISRSLHKEIPSIAPGPSMEWKAVAFLGMIMAS